MFPILAFIISATLSIYSPLSFLSFALSSPLHLASPPPPCHCLPHVRSPRPCNSPANGKLRCEEPSAASWINGMWPHGTPDHFVGDATTVKCCGGCKNRPLGVCGHENPACTAGGIRPAPDSGLAFGGTELLAAALSGCALDIGFAGGGTVVLAAAVLRAAVDAGFAGGIDAVSGPAPGSFCAAPGCGFGVVLGSLGVVLGSLGYSVGYNAGHFTSSHLQKAMGVPGTLAHNGRRTSLRPCVHIERCGPLDRSGHVAGNRFT